MDTLAFCYVIPAIRAYSGLPPVRQCSSRAYIKKDFRCLSTENLFPMFETFQTFVTEFCYAAFCLLHRLLPVEMRL